MFVFCYQKSGSGKETFIRDRAGCWLVQTWIFEMSSSVFSTVNSLSDSRILFQKVESYVLAFLMHFKLSANIKTSRKVHLDSHAPPHTDPTTQPISQCP